MYFIEATVKQIYRNAFIDSGIVYHKRNVCAVWRLRGKFLFGDHCLADGGYSTMTELSRALLDGILARRVLLKHEQ